jgi:hypothetical protein
MGKQPPFVTDSMKSTTTSIYYCKDQPCCACPGKIDGIGITIWVKENGVDWVSLSFHPVCLKSLNRKTDHLIGQLDRGAKPIIFF